MSHTSRSVREHEPRLFMKMERNHFADSSQEPLYAALCGFSGNQVVGTTSGLNPLSAALWASQRQTAYRFGWINAVFNPTKVLLGDDPNCLKDDERNRDWL